MLVGILPWVNVVMAVLLTGITTKGHKSVIMVSPKEAVIYAMTIRISLFLFSIFRIFLLLFAIFCLGGGSDFNLNLASLGRIIFFVTPALEIPMLNGNGLKVGLSLFSASNNDGFCAWISNVMKRVIAFVILLFDSEDIICGFLVYQPAIPSGQVLLQDQFGGLADFKGDSILFKVLLGRTLPQVEHKISLFVRFWQAVGSVTMVTMRLWPRCARRRWDAFAIIAGTVVLMRRDRRRRDAFAIIAGTVVLMRNNRRRRDAFAVIAGAVVLMRRDRGRRAVWI